MAGATAAAESIITAPRRSMGEESEPISPMPPLSIRHAREVWPSHHRFVLQIRGRDLAHTVIDHPTIAHSSRTVLWPKAPLSTRTLSQKPFLIAQFVNNDARHVVNVSKGTSAARTVYTRICKSGQRRSSYYPLPECTLSPAPMPSPEQQFVKLDDLVVLSPSPSPALLPPYPAHLPLGSTKKNGAAQRTTILPSTSRIGQYTMVLAP